MDAIQALQLSSVSGAGYVPSRSSAGSRTNGLAGLDIPQELRSKATGDEDKMRIAAKQFETMLVRLMLKEMRATVPDSGLVEKGSGEKMFQDMMDDELASNTGQGLNLGLADALVRQLSRAKLEKANSASVGK